MIAVRILLIPLAVSLLAVGPAPARVGEEHAPAAPPPAVAARHTLSAVSDEFELVSKNDPLEPGKPGRIDLYLSDFETNAPVSGATVTLQLRSQATGELAWSGTAERDASGGTALR